MLATTSSSQRRSVAGRSGYNAVVSAPPRNLELEAVIVREPDAPDGYLVYGDWLLEQGEPLGELVSVQSARAMDPLDEDLARREKVLLETHARSWVGYFARSRHTWKFGFLESIVVSEASAEDCAELHALLAARFLRDLELELLGHRNFENSQLISALVEGGLPPILRRLALESSNVRSVSLGSIRALYPRLASINDLTIRAWDIDLGPIVLPNVESLALTTDLTLATLHALANAHWPKLTSLSLDFGSRTYESETIEPQAMDPLVAALGRSGSLRHLTLAVWSGGAVLRQLAGTDLLASLTSLSLPRGAIGDDDGRALLEQEGAFAHLAAIDLSDNQLSSEVCMALKKAFGERITVEQQGAIPDEEAYDDIVE